MERLSYALFWAGLISLVLAYLGQLASAVRLHIALPARTVTAGAPAGSESLTRSLPVDADVPLQRYARVLSLLATALLLAAVGTRALAMGGPPFTNMYDFSIALAAGIMTAVAVADWRYGLPGLRLVLVPAAAGLLCYAAAQSPRIHPLVPALQQPSLLMLHVSMGIAAYSAFSVGCGAAVLYLVQRRLRSPALPSLERCEELGFIAAGLGFTCMTLVLVLGALWADTAWGRYWAWDPKESAALFTWLLYAAYLHARVLPEWRGARCSLLLIAGFVAAILTYFGNLYLGGLHAYV